MKICIIGGGLAGLTAALDLSGDHTVDLLERRPFLGGCLSSLSREHYTIEHYYHHCFEGDSHLFSLMEQLGISDRLEWLEGSTGYYVNGVVHPLTTPREIIVYPYLSLIDKARLALLTLRAKRMDRVKLDDVPVKEFLLEQVGENAYTSFFEPLLKSKFGAMRDQVSAAWLISRIAIRSNRTTGGERLGYLKGGFSIMIDRMEKALSDQGVSIETGTPVESMQRSGFEWIVNGTRYDTVISTIPPQELARVSGVAFPAIPYQGAACMTLALDRDVTNGIYWLNMKDPAPYGAIVSHTNFAPLDRYGEHLVYLASYFSGKIPDQHGQRMREDFCSRFHVTDEMIHWDHLEVDPWAGPVYTTGYRQMIPNYEQYGLYMAGMFSRPNYPERSMEGSITAGRQVATCVRRRMDHDQH